MTTTLEAKVIVSAVNNMTGPMASAARSLDQLGQKMEKIGRSMQSLGMKMSAAFTLPAAGIMREAIKLDDAMGDLSKVFVGTDEQMSHMRDTVNAMAQVLPLSHEEITKLYTAANQAGIAFKEQNEWVQLAGEFMVAFNTTADQAALTLAQMKQTLQLTTPELRDLAGAMNIVANNSAATEQQILGVYERVVPLIQFIGGKKASKELAALGGAMVGGMIDPEKAGTGLRNIITRVNKPTKEVAGGFDLINKKVRDFQMSVGGFAKYMQKDLSGAFMKLFDALTRMKKEDALFAISSIAGLRGQDVAIPFLTALPKVVELLEMVQDTEKRANSVSAEFQKRIERVSPQLQFLKNALWNVGFAIADVWLPYIMKAKDVLQKFALSVKTDNPLFIAMAKAFGALAVLGPALTITGFAIEGIGKSLRFLAAIMKSPWLMPFVIAAGAFYIAMKNWEEIEPHVERLGKAFDGLSQAFARLVGEFDTEKLEWKWPEWMSEAGVVETMTQLIDGLANAMERLTRVIDAFREKGLMGGMGQLGEELFGGAGDVGSFLGNSFKLEPGGLLDRWINAAPKVIPQTGGPRNSPLLQDGPMPIKGKVGLEEPIPTAPVKIEGNAMANLRVVIDGPGRVTNMSTWDDGGALKMNLGTSMNDLGAGQ